MTQLEFPFMYDPKTAAQLTWLNGLTDPCEIMWALDVIKFSNTCTSDEHKVYPCFVCGN